MFGKWLRWSSVLLLAALFGCSAASPKGGSSGGGSGNGGGQSTASGGGAGQGGSVQTQALDQELKRHAQMYKEYLQHNSENVTKRQQADRKLLEQLRKQDQKARQDEIKRLQARQGLLEDESDTSQQGTSSSSGNTEAGEKKQ